MMRQALLILTPERAAVFSASAATEGAHRSLSGPTGASLLGWAAAGGNYCKFGQNCHTIFHSGKVRFSNAVLLSASGRPAWPMPQLLTEPKIGLKGITGEENNKRLDAAVAMVGRAPKQEDETEQQHVVLKGFVTGAGECVQPKFAHRLRTALKMGVAAEGQLFGYQHVIAETKTIYAATIECDDNDLTVEVWERLLKRFDNQNLSLGRASNTAYGGGYTCKISEPNGKRLWPTGTFPIAPGTVRVWALSDLALLDKMGNPMLVPDSGAMGLPAGLKFLPRESAMSVRRYAPWNGQLQARDLDRQVIEAGSVFSFEWKGPEPADGPRSAVGLWQEVGLGRIWVNPPMLAVEPGEGPKLDEKADSVWAEATTPADTAAAPNNGLLPSKGVKNWLKMMKPAPAEEATP